MSDPKPFALDGGAVDLVEPDADADAQLDLLPTPPSFGAYRRPAPFTRSADALPLASTPRPTPHNQETEE